MVIRVIGLNFPVYENNEAFVMRLTAMTEVCVCARVYENASTKERITKSRLVPFALFVVLPPGLPLVRVRAVGV